MSTHTKETPVRKQPPKPYFDLPALEHVRNTLTPQEADSIAWARALYRFAAVEEGRAACERAGSDNDN